jgi:hypothetical protein
VLLFIAQVFHRDLPSCGERAKCGRSAMRLPLQVGFQRNSKKAPNKNMAPTIPGIATSTP